jgi:hypothetical protein
MAPVMLMERFAGKCYLLIVSDLEADDSLSAKAASNHFQPVGGMLTMAGLTKSCHSSENSSRS